MAQDLLSETTRLLRSRKGISQRDVAKDCKVSQKWVSLLENGKAKNPSYARLLRVRNYLVAQQKVAA